MNISKVCEYFNILQRAIAFMTAHSEQPVHAACTYNLVEVGFDRDVTLKWGVVLNSTTPHRRIDAVNPFYVPMACYVGTGGTALDPFYIMPAKKVPSAATGKLAADGSVHGISLPRDFGISESGYLTSVMWSEQVVPHICSRIRSGHHRNQWCLLVLDGVGTHVMSAKAMQKFANNKIVVFKMAPHPSADLQPLDRSVFHPVKGQARKHVRQYLLDTGVKTLDVWQLPAVLEPA